MRILLCLLTLALLFAGCTDDEGSASGASGDDGDDTDQNETTPEPTPEPEPVDVYYNGTVTGALDCSLAANDQDPQSPKEQKLSDADINRTFTVSKIAPTDGTPDTAILCISLDGGTTWSTTLSGTVEEGTESIQIAADRAPNGVGYSILIS